MVHMEKGCLEAKSREEIRSRMKLLRKELSKEEWEQKSRKIAERVLSLPEVCRAEIIYLYLSYGKEIDTLWLAAQLLQHKKRIAVPKVIGPGCMEFFEIHSLADCEPGAYGILEPVEDLKNVFITPKEQAVMLLPGLAFDVAGGRMGYGGGYYDRYLERYPLFCKVALAYEFSVLEKLPTEKHDVLMDALVTEERVWTALREKQQKANRNKK